MCNFHKNMYIICDNCLFKIKSTLNKDFTLSKKDTLNRLHMLNLIPYTGIFGLPADSYTLSKDPGQGLQFYFFLCPHDIHTVSRFEFCNALFPNFAGYWHPKCDMCHLPVKNTPFYHSWCTCFNGSDPPDLMHIFIIRWDQHPSSNILNK